MTRTRAIDLSGDEDVSRSATATVSNELCSRLLQAASRNVRDEYAACQLQYCRKPSWGSTPEPRWDGGCDHYGQYHEPVWPGIAMRLMKMNASLRDYIAHQFKGRLRRDVPLPNQLFSDECVDRWNAAPKEQMQREVANSLTLGRNHLKRDVLPFTFTLKWDSDKAFRYILANDKMYKIPVLFRYCFADREGFTDIAARFHDAAFLTYAFQSESYDEIWGDFIPSNLRDVFEALHTSRLSNLAVSH